MKRERTPAYIGTVDLSNMSMYEREATIKALKSLFKNERGIRIRGRLGKNNMFASLYRKNGHLYRSDMVDYRPEHCQSADIYFKR